MNLYVLVGLVKLLEPSGFVVEKEDEFEIHSNQGVMGYLYAHSGIWSIRTYETELTAKRNEPHSFEQTASFATVQEALRRLFKVDSPAQVKVESGISEDDQTSSFQNATLQGADVSVAGSDTTVAFSIATFLVIPDFIAQKGELEVAGYIKMILSKASEVAPGLSFEVQVGLDKEEG